MTQTVYFGQILRPQGIDGAVKVASDFDETDGIDGIRKMHIAKPGGDMLTLSVSSVICRDGDLYIRFAEVTDRNAAESLRGLGIYVSRQDISLPENTNFIEDVIGCRLIDADSDECLGTVTGIRRLSVHDVYIIDTPAGEAMIPALMMIFPAIDVEGKIIRTVKSKFQECLVYQ